MVGVGEIDEGGFPSLAVGATRLRREDLWDASEVEDPARARVLERVLAGSPSLERAFRRTLRSLDPEG